MCGRFNIIDDPLTQLIMEITTGGEWRIETELNVAPTQQVPVLRYGEDGWEMPSMRWWLVPYWSPGPSTKYAMFNAKSETLAKSRAFKGPFERRRCIVPVSGYYEWQKEGKLKLPYYIEPAEASGFAFAGLWDRWHGKNEAGEETTVESCTIITAAAPEAMKHIHHRIPVHLTTDQARQWVAAETPVAELTNMLKPELRITMKVTPVSTVVNNARNKDDRCLEPLGESTVVH